MSLGSPADTRGFVGTLWGFLFVVLSTMMATTQSFFVPPPRPTNQIHHTISNPMMIPIRTTTSTRYETFRLCATKKKKKSNTKNKKKNNSSKQAAPSSGFGGSAMEACPCGSLEPYAKCCGKLHTDANAYQSATAEQVSRARYAAYAKRQVDFIMASTHPLNKNFETDLKHWRDTIRANMYDQFELTKCTIVNERYETINENDTERAYVQFIAELVQRDSQEKTGFMETSTFERAKTHGGWMYLEGTIEAPPLTPGELISAFPSLEASFANDSSKSAPLLGLFFGAAWNKDCQNQMSAITSVLVEDQDTDDPVVDVVYVSSDDSADQMEAFKPTSWSAVPFGNEQERASLKQHFGICATNEMEALAITQKNRKANLPALVLMDKATGRVVSPNAVPDIVGTTEQRSEDDPLASWKAMVSS